MGKDRLAQGYQKASLFALAWDGLWGAIHASEPPVESGCGSSLAETSSFLISPCPLLSPPLPFLPRALPQLTTCTKSLPQDLLPGILRLLTLDMGSHSTYASSPSFAHLPTKWAYLPRSILVGFWGGVNEKRHVKFLVIYALRMTCSFSLPLREVSGCAQGCTSWKERLKSGEPQLTQRQRLHSGTDLPALTYGDRGDLGIKIQHPVAIHVHQVIASALFVIAEKVHSFCILGERRDWIRLTAIP